MATYDELGLVQDLFYEQWELAEARETTIKQLQDALEKLQRRNQILEKLVGDLQKPLVPLVVSLISSLTEHSNADAMISMRAEKLRELIAKRKAMTETSEC